MSETLTGYTEVDTLDRLTVTASRVTWAALADDETAYLYADKGAAFFDGDFEHWFTVLISTGSQSSTKKGTWVLANTIGDLYALDVSEQNHLDVILEVSAGGIPALSLDERVGDTTYSSSSYTEFSLNAPYYLRVVRAEDVGTYGSLYLYIYVDVTRATLLQKLTLELHSKTDFRYIYAVNSRNDGSAQEQSGYAEEFDLTPTNETAGRYGVKDTGWRYVDAYGTERYFIGTPVT